MLLRDRGRRVAAVALVVAGLLVGAACSSSDSSSPPNAAPGAAGTTTGGSTAGGAPATSPRSPVGEVVQLRPLRTSADRRIVDDLDREVLLRGANVNSLGEYWQGVPDVPATIPVTDRDWDAMAARGFSVVRLIITWSRVEPERGRIDQGYLDQVDAHVQAAAARGIYTVIDMHQDAYSAFISTEDPASCPPGTEPAKGWDGAPRWATITDGLSTCITGDRNSSPAVVAAWNHFYDDTDGIRTRFTEAWRAVATRFAGRPEVAGYDLLNEPEVSRPAGELTAAYEDLLADTITAIREAEADAPFRHLLFVEPAIPAGNPVFGIVVPDPARAGVSPENIVAAPHNYAESIGNLPLTIESANDLYLNVAGGLGVPTWIGEYGFWDIEPKTLDKVRRYAADEDRRVLGGTWWQWRQSCGDPHGVQWSDGKGGRARTVEVPAHTSRHLNALECPGNRDLGQTEEFLDVLGRGYPRFAPGRIGELRSDPATGDLTVRATGAPTGETVVVWTPTNASSAEVVATGLAEVTGHEVPGGRIVTAKVTAADWSMTVVPRR